MRNLSILFLLAIVGTLGCQSSKTSNPSVLADSSAYSKASTQGNIFYKPFAEFNGDTLQYLNYNFVEHKEQYIGKNFPVMLHDLEIPVKSSLASINPHDQLTSPSLSLAFNDADTETYIMNNDAGPSYIIIVKWEKPVSTESLFKLYKESDLNWNPSYETLLAGEIIKDISVMKYVSPHSKKK